MWLEAILSSLCGSSGLVFAPFLCVMLRAASLISPSYRRGNRHKAMRSRAHGHGGHMAEVPLGTQVVYLRNPHSWPQHHELTTVLIPPSLPWLLSQLDLTLVQKVFFSGGHVQGEEGSTPQRGGCGHLDPGKNKDKISFNTRVSLTMPVWCLLWSSPGWPEKSQAGSFS